jgi:hypothetical protein
MVRTIRRGAEDDQSQQRHQDQNPSGPSPPTSRSLPDLEDFFLVMLHTTMKSPLVPLRVRSSSEALTMVVPESGATEDGDTAEVCEPIARL